MKFKTTLCLIALVFLINLQALADDNNIKKIALTFDDMIFGGPDPGLERIKETNDKILATLKKYNAPAIGFVNENKLHKNEEYDQRRMILSSWLEAGMDLGNHTYSHMDLHRVPFKEFIADLERGEKTIRELFGSSSKQLRYFRHPYLRTGLSMEIKKDFETYLSEHGYSVAPVSIDNADYVYALVYSTFKSRGDTEAMERLGSAYIAYMEKAVTFYEQASDHLFDRQIPHILLLHANEINADYLGQLLDMLKARGYEFVSISEALNDPAYKSEDKYVGGAGTSWLFRWDFTRGRSFDWRAEPLVDDWVMQAYNSRGNGYE